MPTYCFINLDKKRFEEHVMNVDELMACREGTLYRLPNGDLAERDYEGENIGFPSTTTYPHYSEAAGCHPHQVREYNKFLQDRGVSGAQYVPDGRLKTEDYKSHRKALKALKMFDKNSYL